MFLHGKANRATYILVRAPGQAGNDSNVYQ